MKSTHQKLSKVAPGLYRHEAGHYYAMKKIRGTKKWQALTMGDGSNISDRKLAERAQKEWLLKLEKPAPEAAQIPFGDWLQKLKDSLKDIKSEGTQKKFVWVKQGFTVDAPELLLKPIALIKPSELAEYFGRRAKSLGALAFNDNSRIVKNVFELAVEDGAISESPYDRVKKTIRRMKVTREPAKVPTVEECEQICSHIRNQQFADTAELSADFLEFIHKAALGTAETIKADWEDVRWEEGLIRVKRQKTGEFFEVPIYDHLKPFLLDLHARQEKPAKGALFSILSPKQALYNACRRLGMPAYSPIDFRKARIAWMLKKGIPEGVIAGWQGHRDNGILIRKTYSWVKTTADEEYKKQMLAKLAA